jgi:hypothetical protein
LSQRRERFFAEVVDPVLAEARILDIPLRDVLRHIERHDGRGADRA